MADKNELLFLHGINFNEVPLWQRRGISVLWETYLKDGFNPVTDRAVQVERRRLRVERELPMKEDYRSSMGRLVESV